MRALVIKPRGVIYPRGGQPPAVNLTVSQTVEARQERLRVLKQQRAVSGRAQFRRKMYLLDKRPTHKGLFRNGRLMKLQ